MLKVFSRDIEICEVQSTECVLQCLMSDTRWPSLSHGTSQQRRAFSMPHVLSLFIERIVIKMVTLKNRLNPQSDFLEIRSLVKRVANCMQIRFYTHTKNRTYLEITYVREEEADEGECQRPFSCSTDLMRYKTLKYKRIYIYIFRFTDPLSMLQSCSFRLAATSSPKNLK